MASLSVKFIMCLLFLVMDFMEMSSASILHNSLSTATISTFSDSNQNQLPDNIQDQTPAITKDSLLNNEVNQTTPTLLHANVKTIPTVDPVLSILVSPKNHKVGRQLMENATHTEGLVTANGTTLNESDSSASSTTTEAKVPVTSTTVPTVKPQLPTTSSNTTIIGSQETVIERLSGKIRRVISLFFGALLSPLALVSKRV